MKIALFTWDQETSCGIKFTKSLLESKHDLKGVFARPVKKEESIKLPEDLFYEEFYIAFLQARNVKDEVLEQYPSLKALQRDFDFQIFDFLKHNTETCEKAINNLEVDLIVISGDGILQPWIYNQAKYGAINFHTGITPYYRGNSALYRALKNEEPDKVGFTIHRVIDKVDAGDIIYQEVIPIYENDSEKMIFRRCEDRGAAKFVEIVDLIETTDNAIQVTPQDITLGKEYRGIPSSKQWYELAKQMGTNKWQKQMVTKYE